MKFHATVNLNSTTMALILPHSISRFFQIGNGWSTCLVSSHMNITVYLKSVDGLGPCHPISFHWSDIKPCRETLGKEQCHKALSDSCWMLMILLVKCSMNIITTQVKSVPKLQRPPANVSNYVSFFLGRGEGRESVFLWTRNEACIFWTQTKRRRRTK